MNAHWVKLVSVLALGLAGVLGVACGDDDDDDNPGTNGSGGRGGASGAGTSGSGTSGSGTSGSGTSGSGTSGAGGGGLALPPLDAAALKTALDAGNYLPEIKATKWECKDTVEDGVDLGETKVDFHNGPAGPNEVATTRTCANFSLAGQTFKAEADGGNDAGWPLGAASVKETYDDGDVIEISYYALRADGTWFTAVATPDTPQAPGAGRDFTIDTAQGCGGGACHTGDDFVREGNAVPRSAMLAPPNPYVTPLSSAAHSLVARVPPAGESWFGGRRAL